MNKRRAAEVLTGVAILAVLIAGTIFRASGGSAPPTPTAIPTVATVTVAHVTPVTRHCQMRGQLPDPMCTPGVPGTQVNQDNIKSTICVKGWTSRPGYRPDVTYTEALKRKQMVEYGFTDRLADHEEDHLIPLELGGDPVDPLNLWPEPGASPNAKDEVENYLNKQVCDGNMTLVAAQQAIARDWYSIYLNLHPPTPMPSSTSSASPSPAPSTPVATLAAPTATATIPHAPTWTSIPKQTGKG